MPIIYDIFMTKKNNSVCVIAPYYSKSAFVGSVCIFDEFTSDNQKVPVVIVDEPEQSCLIVLYNIPKQVLDHKKEFNIKIKKGKKILCKKVINYIGEVKQFHTLSISTLVKYEAEYLAEWIEYHLRVGVEHFYIYDNNNIDTSVKNVVTKYVEKGIVTYIPWPYPYKLYNYYLKPFWPVDSHFYTQISQMHHALYKFAYETKWILACDVDEYFYSPKGENLLSVISNYSNDIALQISGYLFGGTVDDLARVKEKGVIKSFLRSELIPTSAKKLIINTARTETYSIHDILKGGTVTIVAKNEIIFNHYRALGWKGRVDELFAREVENTGIIQ